ncbi:MAG: SDR family NAD(P)-dependent oxidoreductase [Pseudomonas piscis]|uniref:SDR family NAD(P)-dependent oxidoreductase n=1 Tax=Pseudomonas piscis TaxID=2614538 RepID=UPI003D2DBA69
MFAGKTVVITGAGSGIGRALALRFAQANSRLALSDINSPALQETLSLLPAGLDARGYTLDVSDCDAVFAHAADIKRDFGTAHVVINNAGAAIAGTVAQTSIAEYQWMMNINLYGVLHGTKAFLPMLLAQREGWVVNVSSVFGLFGYPTQSAYAMSKFAVRGLTECLWLELEGSGVRAVSVHPAGIKSNIEKNSKMAALATEAERSVVHKLDSKMTETAESSAESIYDGLLRGKRRILVGRQAPFSQLMTRLFPDSYPTLLKRLG